MQREFTATCSDAGTVATGDGVPQPRYYGTFPRKIRHYVFERQIISLSFAIRLMTSLPAQIIGLKGRGLLREGYWADITLIRRRFVTVPLTSNRINTPRECLMSSSTVNLSVDEGKITGKLPGRVLTPPKR